MKIIQKLRVTFLSQCFNVKARHVEGADLAGRLGISAATPVSLSELLDKIGDGETNTEHRPADNF